MLLVTIHVKFHMIGTPWTNYVKEMGTFTLGTAWSRQAYTYSTSASYTAADGKIVFYLGGYGTASFPVDVAEVSYKNVSSFTKAIPIQNNSGYICQIL